MVDALSRARAIVRPEGCVIDVHPSAALASVEVSGERTGLVQSDDGPLRHAAAGVALAVALNMGRFAVERRTEFAFCTYGRTIEELRDFVAQNWRGSWIA